MVEDHVSMSFENQRKDVWVLDNLFPLAWSQPPAGIAYPLDGPDDHKEAKQLCISVLLM